MFLSFPFIFLSFHSFSFHFLSFSFHVLPFSFHFHSFSFHFHSFSFHFLSFSFHFHSFRSVAALQNFNPNISTPNILSIFFPLTTLGVEIRSKYAAGNIYIYIYQHVLSTDVLSMIFWCSKYRVSKSHLEHLYPCKFKNIFPKDVLSVCPSIYIHTLH